MDKIIVSVTAVAIILILLLASFCWYRCCVPSGRDDILCVMRMPHGRLWIGILGIIFFSVMDILAVVLFSDDRMFIGFAVF